MSFDTAFDTASFADTAFNIGAAPALSAARAAVLGIVLPDGELGLFDRATIAGVYWPIGEPVVPVDYIELVSYITRAVVLESDITRHIEAQV